MTTKNKKATANGKCNYNYNGNYNYNCNGNYNYNCNGNYNYNYNYNYNGVQQIPFGDDKQERQRQQ